MTPRTASLFIWFWILVIPLSYNVWGLDPALYSKWLLLDLSLLLAGAVVAVALKGDYRTTPAATRWLQLYGAYIALSAIGLALYRVNVSDGFYAWIHMSTLPAFILVLLLIDSRVRIERDEVALAISYMGGIGVLIGGLMYMNEVSNHGLYLAAADVVRAPFAHKNITAEVLLLTLPCSIYAGLASEEKRPIPIAIAAATVLMLVVLLSRAVWAGLIAASVLTTALYLIASGRWRPRWYHAAGVIAAAGLCYWGFRWFLVHTDAGEYISYYYNKRNTIRERQHLWDATWQIIRLHPLTGSGMGSWKVLNMRYALVGLRDYKTFFQQPHNDYLWVLSEQGILAAIAGAAAWAWVGYQLVRRILAAPGDAWLYVLAFILVGYGVYAGLAFPKERAEHGIILAFVVFYILAPTTVQPSHEEDERPASKMPKYTLVLACAIVAAGAWWSGNKMISEVHLRRFFEARGAGNTVAEAAELSQISTTYYPIDGTSTPVDWYRGMLAFVQGDIAGAQRDFAEAIAVNPYHAYSLTNMGTCLNMTGHTAEAEGYFRQALVYTPGFPDAALNMSAIYYNQHQTDSAAIYLLMAADTTTNERYARTLQVITTTEIQALNASKKGMDDPVIQAKVMAMSKNTDWQLNVLKKAYLRHRSVKEQLLDDVLWSIRNEDHDTEASSRFINLNTLEQ